MAWECGLATSIAINTAITQGRLEGGRPGFFVDKRGPPDRAKSPLGTSSTNRLPMIAGRPSTETSWPRTQIRHRAPPRSATRFSPRCFFPGRNRFCPKDPQSSRRMDTHGPDDHRPASCREVFGQGQRLLARKITYRNRLRPASSEKGSSRADGNEVEGNHLENRGSSLSPEEILKRPSANSLFFPAHRLFHRGTLNRHRHGHQKNRWKSSSSCAAWASKNFFEQMEGSRRCAVVSDTRRWSRFKSRQSKTQDPLNVIVDAGSASAKTRCRTEFPPPGKKKPTVQLSRNSLDCRRAGHDRKVAGRSSSLAGAPHSGWSAVSIAESGKPKVRRGRQRPDPLRKSAKGACSMPLTRTRSPKPL